MADIVVINRIFSKYRKDILNELQQQVDFVFLHSRNKSGIKQVSTPYSRQVGSFQYSGNETNLFLNVFPFLFRHRPKLVIHEFAIGIASLIPTYLVTRLLGAKFVIWGHGYDRTKGFHPDRSFMDKLRLFLLRKADAVIFYGEEGKQRMSAHIDPEKMFVAYNCLNTQQLSKVRNDIEREGRQAVKERIGFKHKYNLLYIGRLLAAKRPELLIEVYDRLDDRIKKETAVHFVGDGQEMANLKAMVSEKGMADHVLFHGAVFDDMKTGELLFCSDLMIMPGYVGLSVNHAFNFDCPVMTYQQGADGPFHSPEVEYLIHGETGYLVEEHSAEAMAATVQQHLQDEELRTQMKTNIRNMIENTCSVERFINGFEQAINFVLRTRL